MSGLPADVASFIAKLEQAYPELRVAGPLLARQAPALLAFEAIAHELLQAALHLPDATAAVGKLHWWSEELQRYGAGEARHPLTRHLGTGPAAAVNADALAPLLALAVRRHDAPPPTDLAAQLAACEPAFLGVERLRASLLGSPSAAISPQASLGALTYLLRQLARLPLAGNDDTSAIPMQLLARHQMDRAALTLPGSDRDAVVREQLAAIGTALAALGESLRASAGWLARLRWRCEHWRVRPPPPGDPFSVLWSRLDRAPWNTAWLAWRELRRGD
ncbi:hypothetical protein [Tahibacter sp.]|uniref:hypothetical protein n=1 Tax=Tahibacter sp. TaxID=2056211 RepID=UPI0028C48454|nr:hypothetical protein [Tahibacter sp.]